MIPEDIQRYTNCSLAPHPDVCSRCWYASDTYHTDLSIDTSIEYCPSCGKSTSKAVATEDNIKFRIFGSHVVDPRHYEV